MQGSSAPIDTPSRTRTRRHCTFRAGRDLVHVGGFGNIADVSTWSTKDFYFEFLPARHPVHPRPDAARNFQQRTGQQGNQGKGNQSQSSQNQNAPQSGQNQQQSQGQQGSQGQQSMDQQMTALEQSVQNLEQQLQQQQQNPNQNASQCQACQSQANQALQNLAQSMCQSSAKRDMMKKLLSLSQCAGKCQGFMCNKECQSLSQCMGTKPGGKKAGSGTVESRRAESDATQDNGNRDQLTGQKGSGPSNTSIESADSGSGRATRTATLQEKTFQRQVESFIQREDVPAEVKEGVKEYFKGIQQVGEEKADPAAK